MFNIHLNLFLIWQENGLTESESVKNCKTRHKFIHKCQDFDFLLLSYKLDLVVGVLVGSPSRLLAHPLVILQLATTPFPSHSFEKMVIVEVCWGFYQVLTINLLNSF